MNSSQVLIEMICSHAHSAGQTDHLKCTSVYEEIRQDCPVNTMPTVISYDIIRKFHGPTIVTNHFQDIE